MAHNPDRIGCSFAFTITYDTNDSKSSENFDYGTSTSYGSSTTGKSILGLVANTIYYYKIIATSTQRRTSAYNNSFRTTGNAASISNAISTPERTSGTISYSVSYSSFEVQYITTINYGTNITTISIRNLNPNTKYYFIIN